MRIALDHVTGIVADADAAAAMFGSLTGQAPIPMLDNDQLTVHTIDLLGGELHLVTIRSETDASMSYGLHHVGLRVDDIDRAVTELAERGFRTAGEIVQTAPGIREVFLDPHTTMGILIQLVQRHEAGSARPVRLDAENVGSLVAQGGSTRRGEGSDDDSQR